MTDSMIVSEGREMIQITGDSENGGDYTYLQQSKTVDHRLLFQNNSDEEPDTLRITSSYSNSPAQKTTGTW